MEHSVTEYFHRSVTQIILRTDTAKLQNHLETISGEYLVLSVERSSRNPPLGVGVGRGWRSAIFPITGPQYFGTRAKTFFLTMLLLGSDDFWHLTFYADSGILDSVRTTYVI